MAKLGISLPNDLYKQLEDAADKEDRTVSSVVAEALTGYFASKDGSQPQGPPTSSPPPTQTSPASDPNVMTKLDAIQNTLGQVSADTTIVTKLDALSSSLDRLSSGLAKTTPDSGIGIKIDALQLSIKELLSALNRSTGTSDISRKIDSLQTELSTFIKGLWPWITAVYDDHTYVSQQIFQTVATGFATPPLTRPPASGQQVQP